MRLEFVVINGENAILKVKRIGKHYIIRINDSLERYVCRKVKDEYIVETILPPENKKTDRELKDSLIVDDFLDSLRESGL